MLPTHNEWVIKTCFCVTQVLEKSQRVYVRDRLLLENILWIIVICGVHKRFLTGKRNKIVNWSVKCPWYMGMCIIQRWLHFYTFVILSFLNSPILILDIDLFIYIDLKIKHIVLSVAIVCPHINKTFVF